MYQAIRDHIRSKYFHARNMQLLGVKSGLAQLRAMLTEAGDTKRVIRTDSEKQFVNSIGHHVRTIEHNVDIMLADDTRVVIVPAAPPPPPQPEQT